MTTAAYLATVPGSTRRASWDGDLVGRILDTFAVAQLRVEVVLALPRPRLHHLRTCAMWG